MQRLRARAGSWNLAAKDICVASPEPLEGYDLGWDQERTRMPWITAAGGVVGGCFAYWLVTVTQRAYPLQTGNMPLVSLWPTGVIMYELTMLGAIVTTLVQLLVTARLPRRKLGLYDPEVADGKILLGVLHPHSGAEAEITQLLLDTGALQVKHSSV